MTVGDGLDLTAGTLSVTGAAGSFTTADLKTVTAVNGLITVIAP